MRPILLLPALTSAAYLGGIDMSRACQDQYGAGEWYAKHWDDQNGCGDWKCFPYTGYAIQRSIDTPRACVNQHGGGAWAKCTGGVYDWGCYRD